MGTEGTKVAGVLGVSPPGGASALRPGRKKASFGSMALGGSQHPVGNQTALKSVYASRCTRLGRVTSTRRQRVRVAGNANRRAGCVTSAPLLAQRGGWEHCPGPDGLRNLRPRLRGGGWEHCLPGGLRNPSPWCFGVRDVGTLPGNHTSMLAAARQMCCVTPPPGASASGKGEHHLPGGLRNPSPGASASGKGEHRRGGKPYESACR